MRRRPGIAGLQNAAATRDQFRLVGENVAKVRTDVMKEQLATFRTQLEEFALKHKVLGSGFEVISVGKKKLVRSVPTELNKDHNGILELAQAEGFVTVEQVERKFSWSTGRAIDVLETLLKEGLAMIDDGHRDGKRRYWFPCATLSSDSIGADAKGEAPAPPLTAGGDSSSPTPAAIADSSSPSLDLIPDIARRLTRSSTCASAASTASASLPWGHHLPPSRYTLLTATTAANNYPPRLLLLLHLFTGEQLCLPKVFAPFSRVILTADLLVVIFLSGRATVQHCHAPHVFDDLISVNGTLYALAGGGSVHARGVCVEHEERVVYRVFRWVSEKRMWEMITNLGGRSLFLGLDGFAACVDEDHTGVRGDSLADRRRWGRGGVGLGAVEEVGAEALGGKVAPRVEDAPRSTRCCPAASSETKTTASPASSGSSAMTASACTLPRSPRRHHLNIQVQ
uniref:EAP30-like n=1 Tax=Oryza glaberrima TaxID=4538 RepID=A0A679BBN2_ORYGL|nr:EAP30-like [Oryza glaberrima]